MFVDCEICVRTKVDCRLCRELLVVQCVHTAYCFHHSNCPPVCVCSPLYKCVEKRKVPRFWFDKEVQCLRQGFHQLSGGFIVLRSTTLLRWENSSFVSTSGMLRVQYFLFTFIFHTFHITKIFVGYIGNHDPLCEVHFLTGGLSITSDLPATHSLILWFQWSPANLFFWPCLILYLIIFVFKEPVVETHEKFQGVLVEFVFP